MTTVFRPSHRQLPDPPGPPEIPAVGAIDPLGYGFCAVALMIVREWQGEVGRGTGEGEGWWAEGWWAEGWTAPGSERRDSHPRLKMIMFLMAVHDMPSLPLVFFPAVHLLIFTLFLSQAEVQLLQQLKRRSGGRWAPKQAR